MTQQIIENTNRNTNKSMPNKNMSENPIKIADTTNKTCQRIERVKGTIPNWLPSYLVAQCNGHIQASFKFSVGERLVLYKRKPESPSVWAEKHRVLRMSSLPGKWRHSFTPYIPGILDAARYPGIETSIICKAPQTAGTETGFNLLGWSIDHAPGPAMIVFPDKDTAKDNARDRIIPMIEDSPRLRKYLTGSMDDTTSIRINLRHMPIYLGWSGSVSRLGNKPIRTLILDELDKYQDSKREATSENLAEQRTKTWRGRRMIIKISTPTTENGPIWIAFTEEAHARFDWWVGCPVCGAMQLMIFDNIRWPEGITEPEEVLKNSLAYYQCEHCQAHWYNEQRDKAVQQGQWVERVSGLELFTYLKTHKISKIGFHIPAWISHFVSLSEVAHAFLKYQKTQRLNDLKAFMNQYKAEPWKEEYAVREQDAILALCDSRPRGLVPAPLCGHDSCGNDAKSMGDMPRVAALVAGIDTQSKYFRYVIRAFGYGHEEESWLIQAGTAPTFEALNEILWKSTYQDSAGNSYKVRAAVIDAMGAPGRTKAVYAWCAKYRRALPYQGKQNIEGYIRYSSIEFFPDHKGTKIKIPGGILLRRVDTTFFKSDLAEKLSVTPGDPGTFWLHENTKSRTPSLSVSDMPTISGATVSGTSGTLSASSNGVLAEYAKEMCAEVFNPETLVWENPKNRANHFWDCEVMALVAAWELGLRNKKPRPKNKSTASPQSKTGNKQKRNTPQYSGNAAERLANIRNRR